MGFVYLLIAVDDSGLETHKIGVTKNSVLKRVKQLSTGASGKIDILHIYESINYKLVEQWLHGHYFMSKTTSNNEWFKLSNEDVFNFIPNCKKADEIVSLMLKENPFFKK